MAAPVVAGTVALMLEANPNLTPNLVKAILQYTAQVNAGLQPADAGRGLPQHARRRSPRALLRAAAERATLPEQNTLEPAHFLGQPPRRAAACSPRAAPPGAPATSCGAGDDAAATHGENIVWGENLRHRQLRQHRLGQGQHRLGRSDDGDNIVWGNTDGDNIVWGNGDDDNIVWGNSDDDDNIVWGNAATTTSCGATTAAAPTATTSSGATATTSNIVWGNAEASTTSCGATRDERQHRVGQQRRRRQHHRGATPPATTTIVRRRHRGDRASFEPDRVGRALRCWPLITPTDGRWPWRRCHDRDARTNHAASHRR